IPEIPLIKKSHQQGVAKLALFAYDRASGNYVWNSGTILATASAKDVYIGGAGPIQSGTIRKRNRYIGVNLPLLSDPAAPAESGRPARPMTAPTLALPPSAADLESFAP